MYAVTVTQPGGPEVLEWSEVDDPRPGPGEVVVEVAAAGVNRADLLQRAGFYPPPAGAPPYPGLECSGVVVEVGSGVREWQPGDRVCALLAGGGYAQRVAVPAGQVLPVPDGVDLVDAAALPEVACTVWSNVFETGRLQPGETLLVHGGASGIGTMAIQLAAAHRARVIATARADKHAALRALGAEVLVDYQTEDFVAVTREATGDAGANVILDIMGASYLDRNLRALAVDGRLVVIGLQGGRAAELNLGTLLAKRGTIIATALRSRPVEQKAAIVAAVREHVWPLIASGRVRPVVHTRLPMPEAARAHEVLDASTHVGKVLLVTP
ncbi:MAG: NAD(P)H-quinone oxidoreductase [Micromonosporaceae bacterium]|nr:NAD(P)H-quinone oxidoreductase [Micromonosporaceae bacterium]